MTRVKEIIVVYLLNPVTYIVSGLAAAVLFGLFNASLLWIALLITSLALPVYFGCRWYADFRRARWESLWLEEDFIG